MHLWQPCLPLVMSLACGGPMDIVIVLDGSNSIYPWEPMNHFLQKLLPALDIGPRNTQVKKLPLSCHDKKLKQRSRYTLLTVSYVFLWFQVSVLQYGVEPRFEFTLNQYRTKEEVIKAASKITQMYGSSTNTFKAISYARLVSQQLLHMHI